MLGEKSTLSAPNSSAAQQRKCERYPLLLSPPSTPARPLLGNLPRLFSHAYGNGLDEHGKHKRASKLRILTTCVLLVTLSWPSPSQGSPKGLGTSSSVTITGVVAEPSQNHTLR